MLPPEPNRPCLVVAGQTFNVDDFLTDFGPIDPDIVFHRGEPSSKDGQSSSVSGFLWYLTNADEEYWKQAENLERFLHEHYIGLSSIRGEASCHAVIFLYNRTELEYSTTMELEPSLMGMLAGLNFSAGWHCRRTRKRTRFDVTGSDLGATGNRFGLPVPDAVAVHGERSVGQYRG